MADISRELDRIAEIIAEKTNKAVEEVVNSLIELTQEKTAEEALELLSGINLKYAMESKLAGAFGLYEQGVVTMLGNMYSTTTIPEASLRLLLNNTKSLLVAELTDKLSKNLLQSVVNGIATQQTVSDILAQIDVLTPDLETLVVTAFGQFSNSVTNLMSLNLPENTLYIYIGAYDSKTRTRCEEKIGFGPATRSAIISRFGDMNNEIWNCRHGWEQMSSSPKEQGFQEEKFTGAG